MHEIISFNIAKLAKEKGFDVVVDNYYRASNPLVTDDDLSIGLYENKLKENYNFHAYAGCYLAPTHIEIQDWLRDRKHIRVFVEQKIAGDYGYRIYIKNPNIEEIARKPFIVPKHNYTLHFSTHSEALNAGIEDGLNLI